MVTGRRESVAPFRARLPIGLYRLAAGAGPNSVLVRFRGGVSKNALLKVWSNIALGGAEVLQSSISYIAWLNVTHFASLVLSHIHKAP